MDVSKPKRFSSSKQKSCHYKFLLTGFSSQEKIELAKRILGLGGIYYETQCYKSDCTHIVSGKPIRSEKYLCGCAEGKWLVTGQYIYASAKAGKWLNATKYEWGQNIPGNAGVSIPLLMAPKRWRENREQRKNGAFQGWTVMIMVENTKRRPVVYKRLLEAGGAKVLSPTFKLEDLNSLAKKLTHVFVDKKFENNVKAFSRRGIPCVSPDYIAESLIQDTPPDTKPFCVSTYTTSSIKLSMSSQMSVSSQTSSKSTSSGSLFNSQSTTSLPSSGTSTPIEKRIKHIPQKVLAEAITTAFIKEEDQKSVSTPTVLPVNDSRGIKRKLLESEDTVQDIILRVKKKKSELSGPCFVPYCFEMPTLPTQSKTKKKCALPFNKTFTYMIDATLEEGTYMWFAVINALQTNISSTRYPPAYLMHQLMLIMIKSNNHAISLGAYHLLKQVLCLHCPATSPALRLMYLQSLSTTSYSERQDYSTGGEWNFVCNVISMVLGTDDNDNSENTVCVGDKNHHGDQPHDKSVRDNIQQGKHTQGNNCHGNTLAMEAEPQTKAYILTGEPPVHEFKPSTATDEKAAVMDGTSCSTHDTSLERNNCKLLLQYLVTLFEQDFLAIVEKQKTSPRKTLHMKPALTRQCILSCLLWPNGYPNAISTAVITLLNFLVKSIKCATKISNMTTIVSMVQRMVTIAAECYQQVNVKLDGGLDKGINDLDFAKGIINALTEGGILNCTSSLTLLLETTQPSWLRMRLAECLLAKYDNSLIPLENKPLYHKKLSLQKIVLCYLYLLPKPIVNTTQSHVLEKSHVCNIENQHPTLSSRKSKKTPIRSPTALHTLADSPQTVNSFQQKGGNKRQPFSPSNSDNEQQKKKLLTVHKRNARGETPLHIACMKMNLGKVKELLALPGIDVNASDNAGWTPLHEACNHGHVSVVKELLKYKPPPTILSFFAKDKVNKRPKCGVDLRAAPKCGTTPLHDAVFNGHVNIARMLVKAGGIELINVKNAAGFTPLDCATTDDMRAALNLCSDQGQSDTESSSQDSQLSSQSSLQSTQSNSLDSQSNSQTTGSSSQDRQSCDISQLDSSSQDDSQRLLTSTTHIKSPSDQDYELAIKRQAKSTEDECLQYVTIVQHLLKAYIKVTGLQLFRFELDQSCKDLSLASVYSQEKSDCGDDGICSASKKRKLQGGGVVVILNETNNGTTTVSIPGYNEKSVIDDLLNFADLELHVQNFERHLLKLSHNQKLSEQCKRQLLDLYVLSSPY